MEYKSSVKEKVTTQKESKIRARAYKWLAQFRSLLNNAQVSSSKSEINKNNSDDGFVVLNGGMHAGCTPFEVRRLLIKEEIINKEDLPSNRQSSSSATPQYEWSTENKVNGITSVLATEASTCSHVDYNSHELLHYGPTLPFVIVSAPLNVNAPCLTHISSASSTGIQTFAAPHNAEFCEKENYTKNSIYEVECEGNNTIKYQEDSNDFIIKTNKENNIERHVKRDIFVLPVPLSCQLWNQGSSINFNCGYLFIVQCHTSTMLNAFASKLSKQVLGVELFVQSLMHNSQSSLMTHCRKCDDDEFFVDASAGTSNNDNDKKNNNSKVQCRHLQCLTFKEIPGLLCIPEFLTQHEHDDVLQEMINILKSNSKNEESSRPTTSSEHTIHDKTLQESNNNNNAEMNIAINNVINEENCVTEHKRGRKEFLSRRHVVHFNRRFIYERNTMGEVGDGVGQLPSFYNWMRERIANASSNVIISDPYPFVHKCNNTNIIDNNVHDDDDNDDEGNNGPCEQRCMEKQKSIFTMPGKCEHTTHNASEERWCDQCTANYYYYHHHVHTKGKSASGIAAHVDAHSSIGEYIFVISVGSYTVMDFVHGANVNKAFSVILPARSLVVMSGEARYGWTHAIAEKRTDTLHETIPTQTRGDRISLTWRRGRCEPHYKANCLWPELCDGT